MSITALPVLRAIGVSEPNWTQWNWKVAHWIMTAALRLLIFQISKDKYTSLITYSISCRNDSFSHFGVSASKSTSDIGSVANCFRAPSRNPLAHICHISYLKKSNLVQFPNWEIRKISIYYSFTAYRKKIYKLLSRSVHLHFYHIQGTFLRYVLTEIRKFSRNYIHVLCGCNYFNSS